MQRTDFQLSPHLSSKRSEVFGKAEDSEVCHCNCSMTVKSLGRERGKQIRESTERPMTIQETAPAVVVGARAQAGVVFQIDIDKGSFSGYNGERGP